jgi:hypothetical protein
VFWDGLFSQNPPVRELTEARPDEIWVIQIDPERRAEEPKSMVDILDRRNELAGNLSLYQELYFIEKINDLVDKLGEGESPENKRLRLPGERQGVQAHKGAPDRDVEGAGLCVEARPRPLVHKSPDGLRRRTSRGILEGLNARPGHLPQA